MQAKLVSFGLGALAGLGTATAYFRVNSGPSREENETQNEDILEQQLFKYGRPHLPHSTLTYTSHALLYDHSRKVPAWSAELITKEKITGEANRKRSKFQPDPGVPLQFSSANEDYKGSGWSRGHMTPAGDCKHCQGAMDDTFYLTNIVPQDFDNNSGYWNRLEMFCRDLTKTYSTVQVISGPLFLPSPQQEGEDGRRYVKYQVIGSNNVAVPTHLFKVILAEREHTSPLTPSQSSPPLSQPLSPLTPSQSSPSQSQPLTVTLGVFVIPNKPLGDVSLSQFQVSLDNLETISGIKFHSKLDRSQVGDLCATDTCKLMTAQQFKRFIYSKRLNRATSIEELEQILQESKKEGVAPDVTMTQTEAKKRADLIGQH